MSRKRTSSIQHTNSLLCALFLSVMEFGTDSLLSCMTSHLTKWMTFWKEAIETQKVVWHQRANGWELIRVHQYSAWVLASKRPFYLCKLDAKIYIKILPYWTLLRTEWQWLGKNRSTTALWFVKGFFTSCECGKLQQPLLTTRCTSIRATTWAHMQRGGKMGTCLPPPTWNLKE